MSYPICNPRLALSPILPDGYMALMLRGRVVFLGLTTEPVEDVECDELVLSPGDHAKVVERAKRLS